MCWKFCQTLHNYSILYAAIHSHTAENLPPSCAQTLYDYLILQVAIYSDSASHTCKHTQPSMVVDISAQESASGTYPQQTESMLHHTVNAYFLTSSSNPTEISQVAPSFDASTFWMHFLSSARYRCPTNPTLLDSNQSNHTWWKVIITKMVMSLP